jgi:hypothetical protein
MSKRKGTMRREEGKEVGKIEQEEGRRRHRSGV